MRRSLGLFLALIALFYLCALPAQAQQSIPADLDLALVWEQVHAQPDDFSAACQPLSDVIALDPVLYNAEERFPLASVAKLMVLIEYAQQVDEGHITLSELVDIGTLNLYDLPRTDGGAHRQFLDLYPPGAYRVTLWDVAAIGMIQYSSNAASDYLLDRLRPVNWSGLYGKLDIHDTSYPHPLGMVALLMNNHETGRAVMADVDTLSALDGETYFERYINDLAWRRDEINYRNSPGPRFPGWNVQSVILQQHTATGTAADLLKVMLAIYGPESPLTDNAQFLTRLALQWHGYPVIDATYTEYGAKLGFYSGGTLTLVAFGDPHNGMPVISVALFRNIPRNTYEQMLDADSIGDLAHWMHLNACRGLLDAIEGDQDGNGHNNGNGNGAKFGG